MAFSIRVGMVFVCIYFAFGLRVYALQCNQALLSHLLSSILLTSSLNWRSAYCLRLLWPVFVCVLEWVSLCVCVYCDLISVNYIFQTNNLQRFNYSMVHILPHSMHFNYLRNKLLHFYAIKKINANNLSISVLNQKTTKKKLFIIFAWEKQMRRFL